MKHIMRFLVGLLVFALGGAAFVAGLFGILTFMHWEPNGGVMTAMRVTGTVAGYTIIVAAIYAIGESFIDFWRNGH